MREYWRQTKIADIKAISGIGGRFGREELDIYFVVQMRDGTKRYYQYDSRKAYSDRDELLELYNEYNNVPETYLLENNAHIEVDGKPVFFGYRVENNKGNYEYKTLCEVEQLSKEGKIRDEGWRHLLYICLLEITNGEIIRGELNPTYIQQLKELDITIKS